MIKDEVPKSSIEYIIRKAATNTIFYLPQAMNKSPLEKHISEQAERQYNPSRIEKGAGYAILFYLFILLIMVVFVSLTIGFKIGSISRENPADIVKSE